MFWIGMIVGIIVTIVIAFGVFAVCCKITGVDRDEARNTQNLIATAITNRESTMVLLREGDYLGSVRFEEKW